MASPLSTEYKIVRREQSNLIDACELTEAERAEFDYLNWPAIDAGTDSATFFRRNGELYDLGNFLLTERGGELRRLGYHGLAADSFFSGIAVHLNQEEEFVISALVMT